MSSMCCLHFIILANEAIIKQKGLQSVPLFYTVTTYTINVTTDIASFFLGYFISVKNVHT